MSGRVPRPIQIVIGALVLFLASAILFGWPQVRRAARIGAVARARQQMLELARAVDAYRAVFGPLPAGDSAVAFAALQGNNRSRKVFLQSGMARTNLEGRWLDPWGTPWEIGTGRTWEVRSAGPNRQLGDQDDVSSLTAR